MISCPSEKQLQQWLSDGLSEAECQAIEAHVETCRDVCQPLLDSFSGFEDVLPADAGATPAPQPAVVETPAPPAAAQPNFPGYEILGQLGKGGMGVVYKARHRRMDRLVAIKVLPPGMVHDAAAVARFEREVKAAARLQHPNIVAAYDAAEADGVHFLVMEYVAGIDLAALVRHKGPLTIDQALDFVLQAARGLDYAHRHGIVHRDIKPGNLLVDGEGAVKVLDMGLARIELAQDAGQTELTGMGQIMGTVDYMAPEQALDTHHADARADIYALGITLWYLLTGRAAYMGENAIARLLAHRDQPIPSLRGARPEVSPELEALFMRMAAKRPEDRPQTMTEVIAFLEDGLPRPSRKAAPWGDLPRSSTRDNTSIPQSGDQRRVPAEGDQGRSPHGIAAEGDLGRSPHAIAVVDGDGGQCPPYAPTLTLRSGDLETDPNTEQSLAISLTPTPPRPRGPRRNMLIGAALIGLLAMAAAAAVVIRVQTGEGEIVVESEADGVSVDILRNGEPIKEGWQIHAGADNRWVVRSGKVEVKLPADLRGEFTLDQDTARLVRDGKILVKVTRRNKTDTAAVATEDRDRAAAEWVLSRGGTVGVGVDDQRTVWITSPSELAPSPLQLRGVSLGSDTGVRSADLDRFVGLSHFYDLHLGASGIAADAIPRILKMPRLLTLHLNGTDLRSSDLAALAPLPRLSTIWLSPQTQVDDAWAGFVPLASLRRLIVSGKMGADDVRNCGKLTQLREIWLCNDAEVDESAVADLQRTNPLCRVIVGAPLPKAVGYDPVAELAKSLLGHGVKLEMYIETLGIGAPKASEGDLAAGKVVGISSISLPLGVSLDDEEIRLLDAPAFLRWFGAGASKGADRYAAALANETGLSDIGLWQSDLTDIGLEHLKRLPALVSLSVQDTKVTRAGVEALYKALPDCKIVWNGARSSPPPTADRDRAAAEWVVAQGGMVGYIKASGGGGYTRTAVELPSEPFQLSSANLWGARTVRSADLDRLVGLPRLEQLQLGYTFIDAQALPRLVKLGGLVTLDLNRTRVKSSDLAALAPLSRLGALYLDASQNDDDWASLERLTQLRRLTLFGSSPQDIRRLGQFKQLRALWLPDVDNVDEQAIGELQSINPLCRVIVGDIKAMRAVGDDPVAKLAQRLRAKGALFEMLRFPDNSSGAVPEANLLAGNPPLQIAAITIPEGVSLDTEELQWLSCPWPLFQFSAERAAGADGYAAALAGQTLLASVRLAASDLTDAGLAHLKRLPNLASLEVQGTKVTRAGVEALYKALPDCKIVWNGARSSPPPTADRDRAAAEWVLAQGGKVGLVVDGEGTPLIERRADLPAGRFKLINAVMAGVATMGDDDLDRFEKLDDLLYFNLVGTPIGREALSRLATLPTLQALNIGGTKIMTSDLPALAALPRLQSLAISAKWQVDDQWAGLRPIESLRDLFVYEASADDLHHLAELKQLRTIWLHDAPADVDERVVAELQAANPLCRVLVGLNGAVTSLGRDPDAELARRLLKKKARLGITPFPPGSGPLLTANIEAETAAGGPFDIRRIQLEAGTALDHEELDLLRAPSSLTWFEAYGAVGADRCAAALAGQPLLTSIFISGSDLTDAGLEHLKRMPSLVELGIRETRVTAAGVEALQKALPDCKIHANPPAAKAAE